MTTSSEQVFTINSAARLTGFTIPTIRKRLPELQRAGAIQVGNSWAIPLSALYAAQLMVKVESKEFSTVASKNLLSMTTDEVKDLQAQLAEMKQRATLAEAIAAERKDALDVLKKAMLMLEAGAPRVPVNANVEVTRRGWFGRRK